MKKKIIKATIAAAVLALTVWASSLMEVTPESLVSDQTVCFGNSIADAAGTSTVSIMATLNPDHTVEGRLDLLPSEKDSMTGTFSGTWEKGPDTTSLSVVHAYSAEGVTATTSRSILLNDQYALIDWNGEDDSGLSGEPVPRISCKSMQAE